MPSAILIPTINSPKLVVSYYLRLLGFIKLIKRHDIFYVKNKRMINLQLNIQKNQVSGTDDKL
jgi:hypothetical protein